MSTSSEFQNPSLLLWLEHQAFCGEKEKREGKMGGTEGSKTFLFFFPHPHPHRRLWNLHSFNTHGRPDTQDIVTLSSGQDWSDEWLRFVSVKRAKKIREVELIRSPVLNRSGLFSEEVGGCMIYTFDCIAWFIAQQELRSDCNPKCSV